MQCALFSGACVTMLQSLVFAEGSMQHACPTRIEQRCFEFYNREDINNSRRDVVMEGDESSTQMIFLLQKPRFRGICTIGAREENIRNSEITGKGRSHPWQRTIVATSCSAAAFVARSVDVKTDSTSRYLLPKEATSAGSDWTITGPLFRAFSAEIDIVASQMSVNSSDRGLEGTPPLAASLSMRLLSMPALDLRALTGHRVRAANSREGSQTDGFAAQHRKPPFSTLAMTSRPEGWPHPKAISATIINISMSFRGTRVLSADACNDIDMRTITVDTSVSTSPSFMGAREAHKMADQVLDNLCSKGRYDVRIAATLGRHRRATLNTRCRMASGDRPWERAGTLTQGAWPHACAGLPMKWSRGTVSLRANGEHTMTGDSAVGGPLQDVTRKVGECATVADTAGGKRAPGLSEDLINRVVQSSVVRDKPPNSDCQLPGPRTMVDFSEDDQHAVWRVLGSEPSIHDADSKKAANWVFYKKLLVLNFQKHGARLVTGKKPLQKGRKERKIFNRRRAESGFICEGNSFMSPGEKTQIDRRDGRERVVMGSGGS
ncbi:hypothetical protein FISHEDRAFT_55225 [Fistulina hepatica ATCC 64428]|uniref:Uncharacterized protein n=1 Tax=Fistulina hepatica ATCC 64428 TaxID=1128425 RepID=A0A0D7AP67_9AGAR|nr:hypothetical protein FISHEDRAFT_55225 [Fistulina hepatica ATCC 64428]